MFKMEKILSIVLAIVTICSMSTSVFANESSSMSEGKTSVVEHATEVNSNLSNYSNGSITIDSIVENSIITYSPTHETEGSFSCKYDTFLAGITYTIYFDWKADTNSSGNYILSEITNASVTTHTNHFLTGTAYSAYNVDLTQNTYTISRDKRSVTFNTSYDFIYQYKNQFEVHEKSEDYVVTLDFNDLI